MVRNFVFGYIVDHICPRITRGVAVELWLQKRDIRSYSYTSNQRNGSYCRPLLSVVYQRSGSNCCCWLTIDPYCFSNRRTFTILNCNKRTPFTVKPVSHHTLTNNLFIIFQYAGRKQKRVDNHGYNRCYKSRCPLPEF